MLPASPCALLTSLCCVQELRQTVRSYLADSGCVGFLPTLVTSSRDAYKTVLPRFAVLLREAEFRGRLLGLHLEGPFISPEPGAVGAHDAQHVAPASIEAFQELQGWAEGHIRLLTIAAELPNATDLCRHCVANGTAVPSRWPGITHLTKTQGRAGDRTTRDGLTAAVPALVTPAGGYCRPRLESSVVHSSFMSTRM